MTQGDAMHNDSSELILEVLAEGGSLRLMASPGPDPLYSAFLNDQSLVFIDEGPEIAHNSAWGNWEAGIRAMDRYPWRKLSPHFVHSDYADLVWALLQPTWTQLREPNQSEWARLCRKPQSARERFQGCLLGGAVGDALGAPVEFMRRSEILQAFGPEGLTGYAPAYGGLGKITDDTQMTLFTAEGLLRGWVRGSSKGIVSYPSVVGRAYLRWLRTQDGASASIAVDDDDDDDGGWLLRQPELHQRRAPGNTCLSALRSAKSAGEPARNNSKGCGGVMRVAPVGLFGWICQDSESAQQTFRVGCELAALTHGHPTGSLTAGVLAVLVQQLADGASLTQALNVAKSCLATELAHEETMQAIEQAQILAAAELAPTEAIAQLGQGWVAEEALAIGIYCALVAKDFRHGVLMAVNHDGDSDSTGSITGNLLGTAWGVDAIPDQWLEGLELRAVIAEIAEDLLTFPSWPDAEGEVDEAIWWKYPGC